MRKGFALLFAVMFVVLTGALTALSLSLATSTSKHTADLFVKEQAELAADSYIEYIVLRLLSHEFDNCLNDRDLQGYTKVKDFGINLKLEAKVKYFGAIGACNSGSSVVNVGYEKTKGTVMIDVFVTHLDSEDSNSSKTYPIRIHKKVIQKL